MLAEIDEFLGGAVVVALLQSRQALIVDCGRRHVGLDLRLVFFSAERIEILDRRAGRRWRRRSTPTNDQPGGDRRATTGADDRTALDAASVMRIELNNLDEVEIRTSVIQSIHSI